MSVFFIKIGLVAIGAEQDVWHPVRRSAHLLTDHIQVNFRVAFYDQLIMNMTNDEAVPEGFHGIAEAEYCIHQRNILRYLPICVRFLYQ